MAAIAGTIASMMMNATLPVGTSGAPGTWFNLAAGGMKLRLNSGTSTTSTAGTEIANGGGYATGGSAFTAQCTASTNGGNVTVPAGGQTMSWTNSSGSPWSIASLDITDSGGARTWFGLFNSQPIAVGTGNTFQVAPAGVTISLT